VLVAEVNIAILLTTLISTIFLLIILSYYYLLFLPKRSFAHERTFSSLTIIIPAHNEEKYIALCMQAAAQAAFPGRKEIIVVNDGSTDNTKQAILRQARRIQKHVRLTVLHESHSGKSASINKALRRAKGELVAIVDGDSLIAHDAIVRSLPLIEQKKVAVVCSTIKVHNRKTFLGSFLHVEQVYSSLVRDLVAKVNANIVATGPLSLFRKDALRAIGGFSTQGFAEDADIAIRLLRAGYRVEYAEESVTETNMPVHVRGFIRQRRRFARGTINIIKQHLKFDHSLIQIYTLPLLLFGYLQAVIMACITLYNVFSGYFIYFASKGVYLSYEVIRYFVEWFSVIGLIHWFIRILQGGDPLTYLTVISLATSFLVYPLYLISILRYDHKLTLGNIFVLCFMAPFWTIVMIIYLLSIPEYFRKDQYNIWTK
jgi:cellulose synthase/poly-beta-1,6-N-acetylglucosamine synthase-like glycosyltransferase